MRRFTRLTNAFSKKWENHEYAIALHFAHYNFCRSHKTLSGATPAMAANLTKSIWTLKDLLRAATQFRTLPTVLKGLEISVSKTTAASEVSIQVLM
jgi:hypothetical protein